MFDVVKVGSLFVDVVVIETCVVVVGGAVAGACVGVVVTVEA